MSLPHYFCQSLDVPLSDELHLGLTEAQLAWGQQFQDAVLIHTTAKWSPYKDWPVDRWAAVARHLAEEDGLRVLQLGGPYDKPIPGVAKIDSPGLLYAAGAIAWCRLFMGVDSVFNHISRALKKPSLILWGSTHPQGTGYRQNINLINGMVWRPEMGNDGPVLKCQPCYREYAHLSPLPQSACPYTQPYLHRVLPEDLHPGEPSIHTCMANNTVPVVLHHARHLLRQGPGQ